MTRLPYVIFAFVVALGATFVLPQHPARAAATADAWSANGGSACEKYLTPAVTDAILNSHAAPPKRTDPSSCNSFPIYIKLSAANVAAFRAQVPRIADAHPIGGIGDAAYWNGAGALSAVKGDRGCVINVLVPGSAKVTGEALAKKLGAVCDQLFALP
jgi:hypothetical protein